MNNMKMGKQVDPPCKYHDRCGGCQIQYLTNEDQNIYKQRKVEEILGGFGKVNPIIYMEEPYYYRNKINNTFAYGRGRLISGMYAKNTHNVIDIDKCIIEDPIGGKIIKTIKHIMRRYDMTVYDEDTDTGFLRHVLIRTGFNSGEVMVVLVTADEMFHGSRNFVKLLRKKHPEIVTVVMNINDRDTSMVLGDYEKVLYGPGFIIDELCGKTFRISSRSFYQVNHLQTEKLYKKAIDMADLKGDELVIDAYSGIGTISIIMADRVKKVIGVELNNDGVRDAIRNAKANNADNIEFYQGDAGDFMVDMARTDEKIDIVVLDPPRSGSDEKFLSSLVKLSPEKIVYISCNPETQRRDLDYLIEEGYKVKEIQPVDMFPQTEHIESIVLLVAE